MLPVAPVSSSIASPPFDRPPSPRRQGLERRAPTPAAARISLKWRFALRRGRPAPVGQHRQRPRRLPDELRDRRALHRPEGQLVRRGLPRRLHPPDPRRGRLRLGRRSCSSTRTSASTATPASRPARSTPASPRTSCPSEWAKYAEINANYFKPSAPSAALSQRRRKGRPGRPFFVARRRRHRVPDGRRSVADRVADDVAARGRGGRGRVPAGAGPAVVAGGVEPQPGDHHVGVRGVGVDRDPPARARLRRRSPASRRSAGVVSSLPPCSA